MLTSPDGRLGAARGGRIWPACRLGPGGESWPAAPQAWVEAGLPLEQGATHMADEADDVVLSARERNQDREAAMREYLEWEINLVNDMASDDDHRFRVAIA